MADSTGSGDTTALSRLDADFRIKAGSAVTWTNTDNFTHSVHVAKGGFPDLNLAPGQSGSITFSEPGEYDYVCTFHAQNMKGKVVVER